MKGKRKLDSSAEAKSARLLQIYSRLVNGEILKKADLSQQFHVTVRSVQRDIESLRYFFADQVLPQEIIYDPVRRGYRLLRTNSSALNSGELLAVTKILLESRSLQRDEMLPIVDKLLACCAAGDGQKQIRELITNEVFHYIEPHHGQPLTERLWTLGKAVKQHLVIEVDYLRLKENACVRRTLEPVGLMFSEYYFYLVAFIQDIDRQTHFENPQDMFPTIYRVDRIQSVNLTEERFRLPYRDRFEEGEFRKRVQFMYGGKLEKIRFKYTGPSIEAVLDRLPTAKIVTQDAGGWTISAEVFGKGIDMWLRSQGDFVQKMGGEQCG